MLVGQFLPVQFDGIVLKGEECKGLKNDEFGSTIVLNLILLQDWPTSRGLISSAFHFMMPAYYNNKCFLGLGPNDAVNWELVVSIPYYNDGSGESPHT